ncbi:hypothetical protein [Celeribacter baekdonensis]|uniref:hypothetical protein n=1 Tax=Celeribacter baekdonensis TaxID=875171 RepID=UPI00131EE582|nr:hypothetical protein [Celeribacter baekdonensis]
MQFAKIVGGVVANIIEINSDEIPVYVPAESAKIGDLYQGGEFVTPVPIVDAGAENV